MAEVYSKCVKAGVFITALTVSMAVQASLGSFKQTSKDFRSESKTDDRYFQITEVKTTEVVTPRLYAEETDNGKLTVIPNGISMGICENNMGPLVVPGIEDMDPIGVLNGADVIIDKVINIGKKIWNIVQAGKPSVNIRTDVATALPQGARCWQDLETWQRPQSRVYEVAFRNGFGMEVVKFNYRILWLPGGSFDGAGAFIGYAAMIPTDVNVSWGFSLNAQASVPMVFNMGPKTDPMAGMSMSMIYRVETALQTTEQSQAFFVDGKGGFERQ